MVKYNISEAASLIDEELEVNIICKMLRQLGVLDYRNKPYQSYIDQGYLDFKPETSIYDGISVPLVVGQRGLEFLKERISYHRETKESPYIPSKRTRARRGSEYFNSDPDTYKRPSRR